MDVSEYNVEKRKLEVKYKSSLKKLEEQCVKENSLYKVGDLIRDHIGFIMVEKILAGVSFRGGLPDIIYFGPRYTTTKRPFLNRETRKVWLSNMKGYM